MSGEVGEGEHFVAQGGHEEEVNGRAAGGLRGDEAGHLEGDSAAKAVGLNEVDGGEVAGLAEGVGPGVGQPGMVRSAIDARRAVRSSKAGGGFGEEDELERCRRASRGGETSTGIMPS